MTGSKDGGPRDYSGQDLRGRAFAGRDLRGVNFLGANLRGADLRRVDLREANLVGANLSDTNLLGAQLSGARMWSVEAGRANLQYANLHRTSLKMAHLSEANLSNANLLEANLLAANLELADLSRATVCVANLRGANLACATLADSNLSKANAGVANISTASLERANLSQASLIGANLQSSKLVQANLARANLSDAQLSGAEFSGANLSRANLSGSDLSRADLTEEQLISCSSWLRASIDVHTSRLGRFGLDGLRRFVEGGGNLVQFLKFPAEVRAVVAGTGDGLTLHFNIRLTPIRRFVIDGLILSVLGRETDCRVVDFRQFEKTAIVRLVASDPQDLELVADALWDFVWEQAKSEGLAKADAMAYLATKELRDEVLFLREKLERMVLQLTEEQRQAFADLLALQPSAAALERLDDEGKRHVLEKDKELARTTGQKAAKIVWESGKKKLVGLAEDAVGDVVLGED